MNLKICVRALIAVHVVVEIFIDLVDEFKDLLPNELAEMFIQEEQVKDYSGTAGHYTNKGNQYVADVLYERLLSLPEISSKLVYLK